MKKLRSLVMVSVPTIVFATMLVIACGDDTVFVGGDRDAQADRSQPGSDTGTDLDSGLRADVITPQTVEQFASEVENQLCSRLTDCCFAQPGLPNGGQLDGGRYSREACATLYKNIGFEFSTRGAGQIDGGEATIDKEKGRACLAEIQLMSCNLAGTDMTRIRATCFDALAGTRAVGQPCETALECQRGLFCDGDGGLSGGSCAPLRSDGGACSVYNTGRGPDYDSVVSEEACSWRGGGDTKLRCDSYDFGLGDYRPRDEWRCRPQVGLDAGCNSTVWCKDGICDIDGYECKSPVRIFFKDYCDRVVDAGQ
jgi:hypothetical protein